MSSFLALSPKDCQAYTWRVPTTLSFAQHRALIPVHAGELSHAAASMPLALWQQDDKWQLVAVCGLQAEHNLFIKDGQWLGHYRPNWLQTYPFDLMPVGDKAYPVMDRSSPLLVNGLEGEAFFDAKGQLTAAVAQRIAVLQSCFARSKITQSAIAALLQHQLLTPWPESLTQPLGQKIQGLHLVDEKALHQLSDAAFLALREAMALPLAYALNFSLAQNHLLARLQKINPPAAPTLDVEQMLNFGSDTLKFDF